MGGAWAVPRGLAKPERTCRFLAFSIQKRQNRNERAGKMMGRRGKEAGVTPEEIGNALKTRRKEYQLRQEEVAEFARVSERFVREVEKGKQTVRLDKLIDVLAAVGLELVATDRVPEQLKPFKG